MKQLVYLIFKVIKRRNSSLRKCTG